MSDKQELNCLRPPSALTRIRSLTENVNLNDPVEAVEIIMLASRLLRIVDFRVNALEAERLKAISESLSTPTTAVQPDTGSQ